MLVKTKPSTACCTDEMYVSYLLSEPIYTSCTRFSEIMGNVSHDSVNRFLELWYAHIFLIIHSLPASLGTYYKTFAIPHAGYRTQGGVRCYILSTPLNGILSMPLMTLNLRETYSFVFLSSLLNSLIMHAKI